MALPSGAAAALGADMASKGMGAGPVPDAPDSEPGDGDVYEQIAQDIVTNKDNPKELANYLKEFIERVMSSSGPDAGAEEEET